MSTANDIKAAVRAELDQGARLDFTDRAVCLENLQFLFHAMKASEELLWDAARLSDGELRDYFAAHRLDELGHLDWLESDLQGDVGHAGMLCAAMVGAQFYLVRYVDPCALLGYLVVMECFPASPEQVDELERLHGAQLVRTLRHHAVHDIDHGQDVLEAIDSLDESRRRIIHDSALHTARCMALASHSFVKR